MKPMAPLTNLVAENKKLILGIWKNKSCFGDLYFFEVEHESHIKIEHLDTGKGVYRGTPVNEEENVERYKLGEYCFIQFDLGNIPNGLYIYTNMPKKFRCEAGYIKIQNGAIVGQWQWLADMLSNIKIKASI